MSELARTAPRLDPDHERDTLFPEHLLEVDGRTFSYRQCGHGPMAIVLLHGISSGAGSWWQCAQTLAPHARVIAWNAPGYAASTHLPSASPNATDYAGQLDVLLGQLGVSQCLVVGHSLGALIAAAYSALAPARLRSLVLFSPALGYGAPENRARAQAVRKKRLDALHNRGIAGMAQTLPDRLLSASASPAHHDEVRHNALRLNQQGVTQAIELLCGDDIDAYPVPADTPVFCGENDVVTTPEQSAGYATKHGLRFGLVSNAGHACYVEQPQQVGRLILDALSPETSRVSHG